MRCTLLNKITKILYSHLYSYKKVATISVSVFLLSGLHRPRYEFISPTSTHFCGIPNCILYRHVVGNKKIPSLNKKLHTFLLLVPQHQNAIVRLVRNLEAEDLIVQFTNRVWLFVTKFFEMLLHCINHWWGTTEQDFNIISW